MRCKPFVLFILVLAHFGWAQAAEPFTGTWSIDLRNADARRQGLDCGYAMFKLKQTRSRIDGSHEMATVRCGRLNEGGPVTGIVVGATAVLAVTSGRNGDIVLGTARRVKGKLLWQAGQDVHRGESDGENLILTNGLLTRVSP